MTPEFKAQLLAWVNANAAILGIGFIAFCLLLSAATRRDR